jgi:hypothetical protein
MTVPFGVLRDALSIFGIPFLGLGRIKPINLERNEKQREKDEKTNEQTNREDKNA